MKFSCEIKPTLGRKSVGIIGVDGKTFSSEIGF